jgi:hypothetical protein
MSVSTTRGRPEDLAVVRYQSDLPRYVPHLTAHCQFKIVINILIQPAYMPKYTLILDLHRAVQYSIYRIASEASEGNRGTSTFANF